MVCRKNDQVGNTVCLCLFGNVVIRKGAIKKSVVGKKLRHLKMYYFLKHLKKAKKGQKGPKGQTILFLANCFKKAKWQPW